MEKIVLYLLADMLNIDVENLNLDSELIDLPYFDSLQYVMFISLLREEYKIDIPFEVALKAKTVRDIINCILTLEENL